MIVEITKSNISELDNTFISKDYILSEIENNPFAKILILKENNVVIGYIYYSDIYERVEINQFEINSSHRNCGNGNILLRKVIEIEGKNITLEVREDNYPALSLYEKNGFIRRSIRKGYYQGKDGILMERPKD